MTGNVLPAKQVKHVFRYTSGAAYMKNGEPAVLANYGPVRRAG